MGATPAERRRRNGRDASHGRRHRLVVPAGGGTLPALPAPVPVIAVPVVLAGAGFFTGLLPGHAA